ncbi:MAG: LysR family transcriptional regulator [Rhizobiales bacterium]|nr:LysR family transcriptional regulator [Hyphomicrobiales bacterium]
MNVSLRHLSYLCAVAELGSVQAAAKHHRISTSSILAAIAHAESEFGAMIFFRMASKGTRVTPHGERFITAARSLLHAQDEFVQRVGPLSYATPARVRIGCFRPFSSLFMSALVRKFVDATGPIEIELKEGDVTELYDWLSNGTVDVVMAYDIGPHYPGSATPLCKVPRHVAIHADDPLAGKKEISLKEIAQRDLVLLDLPHTEEFLMAAFDILAERPKVCFRSRSYEAVRSAVVLKFGPTLLNFRPSPLVAADPPEIVRRPLLEKIPAPQVVVVDVYGHIKPAFVRKFIKVAHDFFSDWGQESFAVTTSEGSKGLLIPLPSQHGRTSR